MPNTQTSVPAFTAGQVLTAAQMTEVNTGIPVFATTTTRDAAFGGTGEKTLSEGQFAYIEASNTTQYYDGAAWQTVGASGLTLITTTSPSAATTVTINNCFSSAYRHYLITFNWNGSTADDTYFQFRYGTTTQAAAYYSAFNVASYVGSAGVNGTNNGSLIILNTNADGVTGQMFISNVGNSSQEANFTAQTWAANAGESFNGGGYVNSAQTYTGVIFTNQSGTGIFTGTFSVYGLAAS
jgi:hypothetical protein